MSGPTPEVDEVAGNTRLGLRSAVVVALCAVACLAGPLALGAVAGVGGVLAGQWWIVVLAGSATVVAGAVVLRRRRGRTIC